MSCSPRPPNTHTQEPRKQKQLTINADNLRWIQSTSFLFTVQPAEDSAVDKETQAENITTINSEWVRVHSPEVWPCRECVCMCVCWVRSIVLSIWNIRRSSSSRAMSPQKTAVVEKKEKKKLRSSHSSTCVTKRKCYSPFANNRYLCQRTQLQVYL